MMAQNFKNGSIQTQYVSPLQETTNIFYGTTMGIAGSTQALYYIQGTGGVDTYSICYTTGIGQQSTFITQNALVTAGGGNVNWVIGTDVIQNIIFNNGKMYILTNKYVFTADYRGICTMIVDIVANASSVGNYGMAFDRNNNLYYTTKSSVDDTTSIFKMYTTVNPMSLIPTLLLKSDDGSSVQYYALAVDSSETQYQYLLVSQGNNVIHKIRLDGRYATMETNFPTDGVTKYGNIAVNSQTGTVFVQVYNNDNSVNINQYTCDGNPLPVVTLSPDGTPYNASSSNIVTPIVSNVVNALTTSNTGVLYFTNNERSRISFYTEVISPIQNILKSKSNVILTPDLHQEHSPYENVCFPANTPILTDQGIILIEKINASFHTINNKKIVAITKSLVLEKYLVYFDKHSLKKNYPSQKTIMSGGHKILFNDKMVEARKFIGSFNGVKLAKYDGQFLYNILLDTHETVSVNGMICETLNPNNKIAKLYNGSMDKVTKDKIINEINHKVTKSKTGAFKKTISKNKLK